MIRSLFLSLILAGSGLQAMEGIDKLHTDDIDWNQATLTFQDESVRTDGLGENVGLHYDSEGFFVQNASGTSRVQMVDVGESLRDKSVEEMAHYGIVGKLKVSKFDTGEYTISESTGLNGGAIGGAMAGSYIGYVGVTTACHGLIYMIGWCFGPPGAAIAFGVSKGLTGPIHGLACIGGVAVGTAGAVATGPI